MFSMIFLVFVGFTARDIILRWHQTVAEEEDSSSSHQREFKKEIPSMKIKHVTSGPTLKILYCYSCGYRRAFDEYTNMIRERFPEMNIIGDNFTPNFLRHKMVQFLTIAKMALIALIVANMNPFASMGVRTPNLWFWMTQHKV